VPRLRASRLRAAAGRPPDGHVRLLLAVDLVLLSRRRRPARQRGRLLTTHEKGRALMAGWLLPALCYVLLVGIAGITTKVALRTIEWQPVVYWVPAAYVVPSAILWLVYQKAVVPGIRRGLGSV